MDPHSRLSQYNNRPPKSGPLPPRCMDPPFSKPKQTLSADRTKSPSQKYSTPGPFIDLRPIATNSRVKQNQQLHHDLHLAYVNNALQQKALGDSEAFDELVSQFSFKKISGDMSSPAPQLRLWLSTLSHVVSRLERTHAALVEAIVLMPWTTMDSLFVKSYTSFIGMLVSARPEYLSLVLQNLVKGLAHRSGVQTLNIGVPESSSSPLTRRTVYSRLHHLLQNMLRLVPTLSSTLQSLLVQHFPHKRQTLAAHVTYIRNILHISEYCPELADRILSTIVDRAIQIDVEVQIELEELEEQGINQRPEEVFELDPFDTIIDQEETSDPEGDDDHDDEDTFSDISSDAGQIDDDDEQPADTIPDFDHIQDMVNKLDAILKLVFDYFNSSHAALDPTISLSTNSSRSSTPFTANPPPVSPRPSSSASMEFGKLVRRSKFHNLLSIFDRTIIRTFKSRHTQFLVFWYSSLDPEFSDLFQGMLIEMALLDEKQPTITRVAAVSYIASFVSRAQFVDRQSTRNVISVLCDFLSSRLDGLEIVMREGKELSMAQCTMFYAITQAVCLIFCFRWRDLLEEQADDVDELSGSVMISGGPARKWMRKLDVVQRVISSELNPLKVCSTNVIMQFARVARATDFVYCYSILEANKRSEYANNAPSPMSPPPSAGSKNPSRFFDPSVMNADLNTFFPFDPYRLPSSSRYIDGIYRDWASVAIADDDDEDDEDGDDEEDVQEEHEKQGIDLKNRSRSEDDFTGGLGASFEGMSISPSR